MTPRRLIRPPAPPPKVDPAAEALLPDLGALADEIRRLTDELNRKMRTAREGGVSTRRIAQYVKMSPQTVLDRTGGAGSL